MRRLASRPCRHSVSLPCQIVRERDFRLVADRIVNLSVGGLLVTPADPVLTGERVIVSFCAPEWRIWVDAAGVVARVVHGRRAGEYFRGLGLELDGVGDFARFMLEHVLRSVPPAPPQPRPGHFSSLPALRRLVRGSGRSAPALPIARQSGLG